MRDRVPGLLSQPVDQSTELRLRPRPGDEGHQDGHEKAGDPGDDGRPKRLGQLARESCEYAEVATLDADAGARGQGEPVMHGGGERSGDEPREYAVARRALPEHA